MHELEARRFSFYRKRKNELFLSYIFVTLTFPLTSIITLGYSLAFILSIFGNMPFPANEWNNFIAFAIMFAIVMFGLITYINRFNDIVVKPDGLLVRVYFLIYFWKFVPWKDVMGIFQTRALDLWGSPVWILKVRKLSIWHRILSAQYKAGSPAGIVITYDLEDIDEFLKLIEDRCSTL